MTSHYLKDNDFRVLDAHLYHQIEEIFVLASQRRC